MNQSSKKYIVFDFDGTIADTLELAMKLGSNLAVELGLEPFNEDTLKMVRSKKPQELLKVFGVSKQQLPKLLLRLRKEMHRSIDSLLLIPGTFEALQELHRSGLKLGILTSNSRENVQKFLQNNKIAPLFDFIYTGSNIFGKKAVINRMLKQQGILRKDMVYVGDETRDVEACQKAEVKVIAVSWGFNNRELLEAAGPDQIADHPSELYKAVKLLIA